MFNNALAYTVKITVIETNAKNSQTDNVCKVNVKKLGIVKTRSCVPLDSFLYPELP